MFILIHGLIKDPAQLQDFAGQLASMSATNNALSGKVATNECPTTEMT